VDNGITYEPMLTPDGINANYVSAGSIDTQKVQIMSGMYGAVVLDNYGLSVKDNISKDYKLPTTTKKIEGVDFLDWSNSNLKAFIGVDGKNNGQIYLKGQMQIDGGSTIAGWNVLPNKLSSGAGSSYVALSSDGANAFWAGHETASSAPVRITSGGKLYASGIDVSGKIKITDSSSELNSGKIGGFDASSNGLSNSDTIVLSPQGYTGTVNGTSGSWAIYSKGNFGVSTGGILHAKGAVIEGVITATSGSFNGKITAGEGSIGGFEILSGKLRSTDKKVGMASSTYAGDPSFWAGSIDPWEDRNWTTNMPFYVTNQGYLKAASGTIGGWTINSTSLTRGNTTLGGSGKISFSSGGAFFAMGNGSNHPVASSISVGSTDGF
jgi:hypothetical protein